MKTYIGTKIINAKPMTRGEYNAFRGWTLPADENGADEGHLVEYTDGGAANHPAFKGYVSWSPSDVFEKAYIKVGEVSHLQPHQQRVVGEAAELKDKLDKLKAFLSSEFFKSIPDPERDRLHAQAVVMGQYHSILMERIDAF